MILILSYSLLILVFLITIYLMYIKIKKEKAKNKELFSKKRSAEVRLGLIAEQLVPFSKDFFKKYDPSKLMFLGKPIDFISFEEDKITFIEVKTGISRLSKKQKNIKTLVEDKKVFWDEHRIVFNHQAYENKKLV